MSYKVSFRKRATKEYLESIAWYKSRSIQAAENFVVSIQHALKYYFHISSKKKS